MQQLTAKLLFFQNGLKKLDFKGEIGWKMGVFQHSGETDDGVCLYLFLVYSSSSDLGELTSYLLACYPAGY